VSGNVSLYNESKATGGGSAILPTPAIGGVGLLDDVSKMATIGFKAKGESIVLIGGAVDAEPTHLGQSLWLREIRGIEAGIAPTVDLALELSAGTVIRSLVALNLVSAVHDISDGGLMIAVTEMALAGNVGATIFTDTDRAGGISKATAMCFAEDQGYYVVTCNHEENRKKIVAVCRDANLGVELVGFVGGDAITLKSSDPDYPPQAVATLTDLRAAHESFFKNWMED
jgi:phosphoribosylformylglycinamidine synthase subunit PurL